MASAAPTSSSIKLLSWNICKFGSDKLEDPNFLEYVCRVIISQGADFVGIMEVSCGIGAELVARAVAVLDNLEKEKLTRVRAATAPTQTSFTWKGASSGNTVSNEQYVFLWKDELLVAERTSLWGSITKDDLEGFAGNSQRAELLFASLVKHRLLDEKGNLNWDAYRDIKDQNSSTLPVRMDLNKIDPKITLTSVDSKKELARILMSEAPEEFQEKRRRPPFLWRGAPRASPLTKLVFTLFHSPDAWPLQRFSSNQIGLVPLIRDAPAGVVMGDFNVDSPMMVPYALTYFDKDIEKEAYVRLTKAPGDRGTIRSLPFQRLTGPSFEQQAADAELSATGTYVMLLETNPTSVRSGSVAFGQTPATDQLLSGTVSSCYDKFFVKSPPTQSDEAPTNTAVVVPLIGRLIPQTQQTSQATVPVTYSTASSGFGQTTSNLAVLVYNKWLKIHQDEENPVAAMTNYPLNVHDAHRIYRSAISDHLPILLDYQIG